MSPMYYLRHQAGKYYIQMTNHNDIGIISLSTNKIYKNYVTEPNTHNLGPNKRGGNEWYHGNCRLKYESYTEN